MTTCCVYGCGNNSNRTRGVRYLQFPKNEELCKKWILACRRKKRVCLKTVANLQLDNRTVRDLTWGPTHRSRLLEHFKPVCMIDKNESQKYSGRLKKFRLKLESCPTEKLPTDKPPQITKEEADEIMDWCQIDEEYDRNLEKMVSKLEDTIQYLEKENRYLLHNLEALEQLNTRTLIEINALKNKLGC